VLALGAASFILHSFWIELLGAAYLIYLSSRHFVKKAKKNQQKPRSSFWKTVFLIEFFDLAFALDSIIAGIAFIATPAALPTGLFHPKLWIVYVGGMLGVLFIRYAADLVSRLINRFPGLERSAYLVVGLVGVKLVLEVTIPPPGLEYLFWSAFVITLASSFFRRSRE
jgi:YkoY family integral membrane protein